MWVEKSDNKTGGRGWQLWEPACVSYFICTNPPPCSLGKKANINSILQIRYLEFRVGSSPGPHSHGVVALPCNFQLSGSRVKLRLPQRPLQHRLTLTQRAFMRNRRSGVWSGFRNGLAKWPWPNRFPICRLKGWTSSQRSVLALKCCLTPRKGKSGDS